MRFDAIFMVTVCTVVCALAPIWASADALSCRVAFEKSDVKAVGAIDLFSAYEGEPFSKSEALRKIRNPENRQIFETLLTPEMQIYFLGNGQTGQVFRIVEGKETYVLKYLISDDIVDDELKPLNFLRETFREMGINEFNLPHPERLPGGFVKFEYIRGQSLESLAQLKPELHARLSKEYERRIQEMKQFLFEKGVLKKVSAGEFFSIPGMWLAPKESDVIVDSKTLEMTIVDPY